MHGAHIDYIDRRSVRVDESKAITNVRHAIRNRCVDLLTRVTTEYL